MLRGRVRMYSRVRSCFAIAPFFFGVAFLPLRISCSARRDARTPSVPAPHEPDGDPAALARYLRRQVVVVVVVVGGGGGDGDVDDVGDGGGDVVVVFVICMVGFFCCALVGDVCVGFA